MKKTLPKRTRNVRLSNSESGFDGLRLFSSVLLCEFAGFAGSIFTMPAIPMWYAMLEKPSFSPPNWVFGPVWTTLYLLMGVALYLVWKQGIQKKAVQGAMKVFAVQLSLNVLWSIWFFGLRKPSWAAGEILVLLGCILWTIAKFWKVSKTAAYLLVPYAAWVSFATILNIAIAVLNR